MTDKIAPCPWCGGKTSIDYDVAGRCYIACDNDNCTATGPTCDIREDAIAAWNRTAQRPTPIADAELSALEAAAMAATPGPWKHLAGQGIISTVSTDTEPNIGLAICYGPNAAHIAAANPATVLDLIRRVREAEGRCKVRWEDLGPSMAAHAFLGGMEIGRVHPHVNGGWCWAASNLPAEGHKDDKGTARSALEAAVREAMRHD